MGRDRGNRFEHGGLSSACSGRADYHLQSMATKRIRKPRSGMKFRLTADFRGLNAAADGGGDMKKFHEN